MTKRPAKDDSPTPSLNDESEEATEGDEMIEEAEVEAEVDAETKEEPQALVPDTRSRLSRYFLKPARPRPSASSSKRDANALDSDEEKITPEEHARRIRLIDKMEAKVGYLGAALLAALAALAVLPFVIDPNTPIPATINRSGKTCPAGFKGSLSHGVQVCSGKLIYPRTHYIEELGILLFFALLIAAAVRMKRRSFLAFAALMSGFAIESTSGSIIGLPFIIAGGWLFVRAYRVQKYGTPSSKGAAQAAAARPRRSEVKKKKAKGAVSTAPTGRPKPPPSKRYTPKAPPRKKPPPVE